MRDQSNIDLAQQQQQPPQPQPIVQQQPQIGQRQQIVAQNDQVMLAEIRQERQNFGYIILALFFVLIISSGVSVYFVVQQSRHTHNVAHEVAIAARKMDAVVRIYKEAKDETHLYTSAIKMMGQIQTAMISEQQSKMITNSALQDSDRDLHDL